MSHVSHVSFGPRRRKHVPPESPGQSLFTEETWARLAPTLKLSPRELQIVRFVFDEYALNQMAEALELSRHTVHTHLMRVYGKLGVTTRAGMVVCVCGVQKTMPEVKVEAAVDAQSEIEPEIEPEIESEIEAEVGAEVVEAEVKAASEVELKPECDEAAHAEQNGRPRKAVKLTKRAA